jgi:hypothetical protein
MTTLKTLIRLPAAETKVNVRRLDAMSSTERALLGFYVAVGAVGLPQKQAARIVGTPPAYISAIVHATEDERNSLRNGALTVSELHNRKRKQTKPPVDDNDEVDRLIAQIGCDKILAALDRYTAPQFTFEAAE